MFHVKQTKKEESVMKIVTARPHCLLDEMISRIGALVASGEGCMLIVPSQITLQTEIEVLTKLDLEGSFLIDVLSPARLQSRVFERAGAPERTLFDERGKRMVLSDLIEREKSSLTMYRASSGFSGFTAQVSSLIADFKRSGVSAKSLSERIAGLPEDSPIRQKLADVSCVFSAYEQRMAGQLADAEDISEEMLSRLERSEVVRGKHLFVFGFDMITQVFARQLVRLSQCSAQLTLLIETDEESAPDAVLFTPVNRSIERLSQFAAEQGEIIERERLDREPCVPPDIRLLSRGLFAAVYPEVPGEPDHIELNVATNMRQEVHAVAARIRRMMYEGADSADFAIVYPASSGYAPLLLNILPQYGIPAYIAEKRPASSHPLCRFLLHAFAAVGSGWRVTDVVECVQTGFFDLSREQIDALCAHMEDSGLRAGEMRRPFTALPDGQDAQDAQQRLDALNQSREIVMRPLERFARALADAGTADETIAAVVQLLEDVQAVSRLEALRAELTDAGLFPEAEDCAQVYHALMETLDQLHTLLGSRGASANVARTLLAEGLSALELSALPPVEGAVICGEIGNVRTAQVGTLFAIGFNDRPGADDEGLFTAAEKEEAVRATGAYLGMDAAERAALAQLDVLKSLSGANERVIISYALADETGRALREDAAVQSLRRLFPRLAVRGALAETEQRNMLCAPTPAIEALSVRFSDACDGKLSLTALDAQAESALETMEKTREILQSACSRLVPPPMPRLHQARRLYGKPVMSVSRLETHAQCPFKHFVQYGLSPTRQSEPGVDSAALGTLYHAAAERFTQDVMQDPNFPNIDGETCDRRMDEAVKPLIDAWRATPFGASSRGEAITRRIGKTARRTGRNILSQFADSRFRPFQTEIVFGRDGVAPVILEMADGSIATLQGRIDRVDVLGDDGHMIRVIDYKSGAHKFDPTMVYWGLQLQLLLYLDAALSLIPGSKPAGFFYCRIADPTIRTESRIKEEVEEQIAKKLKLAGISLSDVSIVREHGFTSMIKKDGTLSAAHSASMADEQAMESMLSFAKRKATQLAEDIYAGDIDVSPYEYGQMTACATCGFAEICGFDPAVSMRRRLQKKEIGDLWGG